MHNCARRLHVPLCADLCSHYFNSFIIFFYCLSHILYTISNVSPNEASANQPTNRRRERQFFGFFFAASAAARQVIYMGMIHKLWLHFYHWWVLRKRLTFKHRQKARRNQFTYLKITKKKFLPLFGENRIFALYGKNWNHQHPPDRVMCVKTEWKMILLTVGIVVSLVQEYVRMYF